MPRMRIAIVATLFLGTACSAAPDADSPRPPPARPTPAPAPASPTAAPTTPTSGTRTALPKSIERWYDGDFLAEPSGIVDHPARGSLFAVSDEGQIAELSLEGRILAKARTKDWTIDGDGGRKLDLEGVTLGPGGLLLVAEEDPPSIIVLACEGLAPLRRVAIDPTLEGERVLGVTRGGAIEGITWVESEQRLFAVNQLGPARLVELALPAGWDSPAPPAAREGVGRPGETPREARDATRTATLTLATLPAPARVRRIVRELDLEGISCASDLRWEPRTQRFLVISSSYQERRGMLFELSREGRVLASREVPGEAQEGYAVDADGRAYIAQDTGGILRGR